MWAVGRLQLGIVTGVLSTWSTAFISSAV
jgi:hypothetical protein